MTTGASESAVQAAERLRAAAAGDRLFRNNTGALKDATGRLVRFGLGNESAAVIAGWKPSDLIGWRPRLITPDMVGDVIAQFLARECKPEGWHLTPGDKRGQAQLRFGDMLRRDGGDFEFVADVWPGVSHGRL